MDAAKLSAQRARKRARATLYRNNVKSKLRKVDDRILAGALKTTEYFRLIDSRDELCRKLGRRRVPDVADSSSLPEKRQRTQSVREDTGCTSSSSDSEGSGGSGYAPNQVSDFVNSVASPRRGEPHNQEPDDQEPNNQEPNNQEPDRQGPHEPTEDFEEVHLPPFSPPPPVASVDDQDRDRLITFNKVSRRELNAMLLGAKVKEHYSENNSMTQRIIVNSFIPKKREKLVTGIHKHKEYLKRMCPIPRDWVLFCYRCGMVSKRRRIRSERSNTTKVREDFECRNCDIIITDKCVKRNHCRFILCSIRAQIVSYLKGTHLGLLLERSAAISRATSEGEMHKHLKFPGFFDLSIMCDAAPITKRSKVNIFPCMLFFNNIPPNYQLRFPILAGIFSGPHETIPHVCPFFQEIKRELSDLAKNPIVWTAADGIQHTTTVVVTLSQNDTKQKSLMLHINDTPGRYCCPYCYERGVDLGGGHYKIKNLVHRSNSAPWRTEEDYLRRSKIAAEAVAEGLEVDVEETLGVKGFPVLYRMPHFDAIWSTTPDTLHVVYEGVLKKIVHNMCTGKYNPNGILKRNEDFTGTLLAL